MKYEVIFDSPVYDELNVVPANYKRRIFDLIKSLANDPYPVQSKQMDDPLTHLRRARLDKWRVVYAVDETENVITILRVKQKSSTTYEELE